MDTSKLKLISAKLDKIADSYNVGMGQLLSSGFDKFDLELDPKFKEIALRTDLDINQKFELCKQRVEEMLNDEEEDKYTLHNLLEKDYKIDTNQIQEALEQIIEDSDL